MKLVVNLVQLAQKAVESYVTDGSIISPPPELFAEFSKKKAGVFVTIKKGSELRGCIGTYLPTKENIAQEVIANSIAAATEDYRFGTIKKQELPYLSYTVYILSKPEMVGDIKELNPKKYGIIIRTAPIIFSDMADRREVVFNGSFVPKSGLLLPDLEGIDTSQQQILTVCQKGGINPEREKILIYKFEVEKHQ